MDTNAMSTPSASWIDADECRRSCSRRGDSNRSPISSPTSRATDNGPARCSTDRGPSRVTPITVTCPIGSRSRYSVHVPSAGRYRVPMTTVRLLAAADARTVPSRPTRRAICCIRRVTYCGSRCRPDGWVNISSASWTGRPCSSGSAPLSHLSPTAARSSSWRSRCPIRDPISVGSRSTLRLPLRVFGGHTPYAVSFLTICWEIVSTAAASSRPDQVAPHASPRRRPANAISSNIADSRSPAASSRNRPTSSASHGSTSGGVYDASSTPSAGLKLIIRCFTASFSALRSICKTSFTVAGPIGRPGRSWDAVAASFNAVSMCSARRPATGNSPRYGTRCSLTNCS
ncbi:hypothetical protein BL254_18375 [Protofrankia sp. BMG5.30]|uniref:Uncharacterized protein n=1 Tax=Protofrankia coriariae TaxID=1562887 RepID=A0ABR5F2A8_9ACTN|nr:hypothetical protein FrCorBMG51_15410 [Protofrankia coriariae]ONH34007.1 hypothetical protein BL254_18375 [Protofrankia sp. BMG5.30]